MLDKKQYRQLDLLQLLLSRELYHPPMAQAILKKEIAIFLILENFQKHLISEHYQDSIYFLTFILVMSSISPICHFFPFPSLLSFPLISCDPLATCASYSTCFARPSICAIRQVPVSIPSCKRKMIRDRKITTINLRTVKIVL